MELVRDVMQPDVICVPEKMSVRELCNTLGNNGIAGAPVVDAQDYLVGVVSLTDVARFAARGKRSSQPSGYWDRQAPEIEIDPTDLRDKTLVRDIMNRRVYKVSNQANIKEAVDLMLSEDIHRVIVTHRDRVIGIVTSMDLMKVFSQRLEREG